MVEVGHGLVMDGGIAIGSGSIVLAGLMRHFLDVRRLRQLLGDDVDSATRIRSRCSSGKARQSRSGLAGWLLGCGVRGTAAVRDPCMTNLLADSSSGALIPLHQLQ